MSDFEALIRLMSVAPATEEEVWSARANRDYSDEQGPLLEARRTPVVAPQLDDEGVRALVSDEARVMIIGFEVSSEAYYQKKYEKPILPGVQSGITVGIGYDLGYNTVETVRRDFAGLIPADDIEALARCCQLKGQAARPLLDDVKNIRVPLDAAKQVFDRVTIPRFGRQVLQTFPNAVDLKGHCFGAILSLVFNRGSSLEGDRRREMRQIRDLMEERRWDEIPDQFRAMKRIWEGDPQARGLLKRRDCEAELFARGLALMTAPAGSQETAKLESLRPVSAQQLEGDGYAYRELDPSLESVEQSSTQWDKVTWPADDSSPIYAHHLDRSSSGSVFEFKPEDLELLIELNGFKPSRETGRFVFALRGAELVQSIERPEPSSPQENREALILREVRPDHKTFRCMIGVYDAERGRLSAYRASTVPNQKAVASYAGGGSPSNMMLTGCFEFQVGWHQESKEERKIPGCLIEHGRNKAVLRSPDKYTFDLTARVEDTNPGDNLHPSKSEGPFPFSSWGCLVPQGSVTPSLGGDRTAVTHTGEWAQFRKALGLPDRGTGGHGRTVDVVLLTGLDAAIAVRARTDRQNVAGEVVRQHLVRLRQGSQGTPVAALRQALGLRAGDVFTSEVAAKLALLQKSKLGAVYGVYAPWMDEKLGLDVLAKKPQVLRPESVAAARAGGAAVSTSEHDQLAFELGAQFETKRGGRSLSEDAHHESLIAAVSAFGSAALLATGGDLIRQAELLLHGYICGESATTLIDRDDIRRRIDAAAETGLVSLKKVLATLLRQATFSFAPYDLTERVVGYLLDQVVKPRLGSAGDMALGRIDGGVAWLCSVWCERLDLKPAAGATPSITPISEQPKPSTQPPTSAPPAPPVADDETARLLNLLEAAAEGAAPDVAGVRAYVRRLRDRLKATGAALTVEQNQRFLDILCDTRFMDQLAGGSSGPDPYLIMGDIEAALGEARVDIAAIDKRIDQLCDVLGDARLLVQGERVEGMILALRKRRLHDQIARVADRALTRSPDAGLLARIAPHYARALIDSGKIIAGIEVLHATLERGQLSAEQGAQLWGGLGRAHKQIYVNHVRSRSDAIALQRTLGPQLARAIDAYSKLYDPATPAINSWYGINVVALLNLAEADGIDVGKRLDANILAQQLITAVEPTLARNTDDPHAIATLGEAYLALGKFDLAARYYADFAAHPKVDAFTLNSAVRQLEEVWRLEASREDGGAILIGLKSALAQKEGGRIMLSPGERKAIANVKQAEHQERFESTVKGGKYVPLAYLKRLVMTGVAVAAIKQKSTNGRPGTGDTIGTGFLFDGTAMGLEAGTSYLLTNAHVMWDRNRGQGSEDSALAPDAAEIVFDADDNQNSVFLPREVLWQSPSALHDACLIALDRRVEKIEPLQIAPKTVALVPDTENGTTLAVVGHPRGGPLAIGITGALEEISARLLDMGPRMAPTPSGQEPLYLHYSVPTEPGNSGSPVLEASDWRVVGLHHAGFDEKHGRPKLGGKAGVNAANEGIHIQSICEAVRNARQPQASAEPARKRGWF